MKKITINDIRSWSPCYDPNKYLAEDWSGTALDILDLKQVPFNDRRWVILRNELVTDRMMRLFAVWCARQVLHIANDERCSVAAYTAERYAYGLATNDELMLAKDAASAAAWAAARDAARDAASAAASAAARDAARDAASAADWAAARDAARTAASAAARDAASAAARDAARTAARDAAWAAQENQLRKMLIDGEKTGDTL